MIGAVLLAILTGLATGAGTGWGEHLFHPASDTPISIIADPTVTITTVEWIPNEPSRYKVIGVVRNLGVGEVLWTFTQETINPVNTIYPDLGPCPVGDDGAFSCSLGFAWYHRLSS